MIKDTRIEAGLLSLFRLASGFWLVVHALTLFASAVDPQAPVTPWAAINVFVAVFF